MKNPKEMTDEELYHALKARKIRLGVAHEVANTYSPRRVVLTTIISPVHAVRQVSVNVTGTVAHEYTKSKMDDVAKEMDQRGLDSKKFDNDPETEVYISKWVKLWKCVKLIGSIVAIDLSEVHGLIEVVSDLHEAAVDFCDVINDISELCLAIMDGDHFDNVQDGFIHASNAVDNLTAVDNLNSDSLFEGFKNVTSSIDLSTFIKVFTDDKKVSTENTVKPVKPKRFVVNIANLRKILENQISKCPTTRQLFISSKSENTENLTTDVTKDDNESLTKEKSDSVLNERIQNITTAAASINISNI
ncbi:26246_t:CDS:2, partial [Dentiscutata erythropus]